MALGTWNPADNSVSVEYTIDTAVLRQCIGFAETGDWTQFPAWSATLPPQAAQLCKLEHSVWKKPLQDLSDTELHALLRFFTLAETHSDKWHGGDKNPVIWIGRELKQRGKPLGRDDIQWIRANSNNRFLPNGPIL